MLLLSLNVTVYAGEISTGDEFPEAQKARERITRDSATENVVPNGAIEATEEEMIEAAKESKTDILENEIMSKATWVYLSNYIIYAQNTVYNCGPACVQAALRNLNGSAPSQSTIEMECGTTITGTRLSNMIKYINTKQSKNKYIAKYEVDSTTMKDCIYRGIVTYKAAPIIGMKFRKSEGWLYDTNAHFMSIYGINRDRTSVSLADPWIGYSEKLSNRSWSYTKSSDMVYKAYNSVNCGLMY